MAGWRLAATTATMDAFMSTAPRTIGPYHVVRVLGRGGMGLVYEGVDPVVGRRVALKVILGAGLDSEAVARFEREARLLARVKHGNVVTVHALEHMGRSPVLVTELIEGARPLEPGRLAPREAALIVRTIADGVEAVHRAGVLHRDLKPENVMRRADGSVVLLDFGLARELDGSSLTRSGDVVGTPAFMAPEQVQGRRDLDARVDVYGLGALLYALLVGSPPFEGGIVQILAAVLERTPRWPRERAGAPAGLDEIVRRAMAKAPADRPPSAAALRDELDRWLAAPAEGRSRRRSVAAVLALMGAVALGLAAARRDAPPADETPAAPVVAVAPVAAVPVESTPVGVAGDLLDALLAEARAGALAKGRRDEPLFVGVPPVEMYGSGRGAGAVFVEARRLLVVILGAARAGTVQVTSRGLDWTPLAPLPEVGSIQCAAAALGDGRVALAGQGGIVLVDLATHERRRVTDLPVSEMVSAGARLLFSDGRCIRVVDVDGAPPRQVMDLGPPSARRSVELALTPDGAEGVVLVVEGGQFVRDTRAHGLRLAGSAGAPDESYPLNLPPGLARKSVAIAADRRIAFGGDSFSLEVWTAGSTRTESLDIGETLGLPAFNRVAFSPRGRVVYAASQTVQQHMTNELVAWTPGGAARRAGRGDAASSIAVSPDGLLLAVGTFDGRVEVWVAGDDVE